VTPAQRFFPEILRLVAVAYDVNLDELTAEEQWARDDIREARRVAYVVASDVVQLTHRQIGQAMQRDHKAIHAGIGKCRRDMVRNRLLRKVVADVGARVRDAVQDFRLFGAEAAE
jgi:chromosomal replication initiation ATPase DnaA